VNLAQQYADLGYDPDALISRLATIVVHDNFTEMHALKHHQATVEEFHATRLPWRWRHLVSAAQASAISYGKNTGDLRGGARAPPRLASRSLALPAAVDFGRQGRDRGARRGAEGQGWRWRKGVQDRDGDHRRGDQAISGQRQRARTCRRGRRARRPGTRGRPRRCVADGRAYPVPTLAHRRVREADRTHGRCNSTALAICLKLRE
jgi:hypothetical protein